MRESNKRIAKNTVFLYVRSLVMMGLSFFSTRIVLDKLGAADYGLNNIVAGFVGMFTVMNNILQGGTRRFFALNMGKEDPDLLKRTFSTTFVIHLVMGGVVLLALECVGPWYINHGLNVDPDRVWAAHWVFQLAVVGVVCGVAQTPYTAAVTTHEHFAIYSYMSIFDVVAKLLILYLLVYLPFDKLIVYAALTLSVNLLNMLIYRLYCVRQFPECRVSWVVDKPLCKEIFQFSGWTVLGHLTVVVNGQGSRILLNLFYDTVMNAAQGLASTVSSVVDQFIGNFMVAGDPQIIKRYGAGDKQGFERLLFNLGQYSIFILAFFAVPMFMELDFVLGLWLTEVPAYTSAFVKVGLACSFVHMVNGIVDKGIVAGGYVKQLNTLSIPLYLFSLPLVYGVLWLGWHPAWVSVATTVPALVVFLINLWLIKRYMGFPSRRYFFQIFLKNMFLIALACIPPYLLRSAMGEGWLRFLAVCSLSVVSTMTVMYAFALNAEMKDMLKEQIRKRIRRQ